MQIKRVYRPGMDTAAIRAMPNGVVPQGSVDHVLFMNAHGPSLPPDRQSFGQKTISRAMHEGWGTWDGEAMVLTIKTDLGEVRYKAERYPGRWCCHCGEKLEDDDNAVITGALACKHVAENHAGDVVPAGTKPGRLPKGWTPAGYRKLNHYECVREG